jgi:Flp pilus assembly protein TadG
MPIRISPLSRLLRVFTRRRFARNERGATAIEFALLALPFFAIIGATLETAMVFLASEVLDAAVNDANRKILTGQAQTAGYELDDFRADVCGHTWGLFDCADIHFRVTTVADFKSASVVPPIAQDCEAPCEWNEVQLFDPGQGSSIVVVQAYYKWPTILDIGGFDLATLSDGSRLLATVRVFRNEPFTTSSSSS